MNFDQADSSRCRFLTFGSATLFRFSCLNVRFRRRATVLEMMRLVVGLDDMVVMRQPVEEGRRHIGVAEHAGPFTERQVGRGHGAGAFILLR